jgi:hypothetical protein
MTIGATVVADYSDVLAADPVSGGPLIQDENIAGASAPKFFERGNKRFQRKFKLTKEWPDNKQSAAWYMTDGPALCGVADVFMTHMAYDGTQDTWKVAGAKVEITVKEPIGVTTESDITITGGLPVLQA